MTDTPNYPEEDEISILDLLQTIVDNLRLLVIGPIVAGLLALAGASFWPKTYLSTAILKAEPITANIMLSAAVLDPIASSLGYSAQMDTDDARQKLKGQIKANVNNKDPSQSRRNLVSRNGLIQGKYRQVITIPISAAIGVTKNAARHPKD